MTCLSTAPIFIEPDAALAELGLGVGSGEGLGLGEAEAEDWDEADLEVPKGIRRAFVLICC